MRIGGALALFVACEREFLVVIQQVRRVIKVRVDLVQIAEELDRSRVSTAPLECRYRRVPTFRSLP